MKGVAIPYVIALVLGIVVIGLIGYWFISQGGKTIVTGSKAECDTKTASYCLAWKNSFPNKPQWNADPKCEDKSEPTENKCSDLGISIPKR